MLGTKRSRDSPRGPPESVLPGEGLVGVSDVPTSPIETKVGSTNKWRSKETETEAVGLGIIAALLKSGEVQGKFVVGSPSLSRRCPISVVSRKDSHGNGRVDDKSEVGRSESYTCITCSAQQPSVYYQGNEVGRRVGDEFLQKNRDDGRNSRNMGVFLASPPRFTEDFMGFQTSDFLSYCHLCWKKLHGKDIYMYRGEKAFCSAECRYRQIVSDEYQEKCRSEASEISLPTYTTDVLLPPGIFAV